MGGDKMNFFVTEEMPELYFYNADELSEYLREVEDHYIRNDWTYGSYKDDDGRYRYYEDKHEDGYGYLTIKGFCRRAQITFPCDDLGKDQRIPYDGIKKFEKVD